MHHCREILTNEVKNTSFNTNDKVIRVVVEFSTHRKNKRSWLERSLKNLNTVEKYMNWRKTTIHKLRGCKNIFIFNSSIKWVRSPQLFSLYLLLIRIGKFKIKDYNIITDKEAFLNLSNCRDKKHIITIQKKLKLILNNVNYLFFGRTMIQNFFRQNGSSGIYNLVNNIAEDPYIIKRYKIINKGIK